MPGTKQRGFTLIEALLAIAIVGIISALSLPAGRDMLLRNDLSNTTSQLVDVLRKAQTLAHNGSEDSNWGVYLNTGTITLYKGNEYSSRDTSFDENTTIPSSISLGGVSETNFAKISGLPTDPESITLSSTSGQSSVINISSEGVVSF